MLETGEGGKCMLKHRAPPRADQLRPNGKVSYTVRSKRIDCINFQNGRKFASHPMLTMVTITDAPEADTLINTPIRESLFRFQTQDTVARVSQAIHVTGSDQS